MCDIRKSIWQIIYTKFMYDDTCYRADLAATAPTHNVKILFTVIDVPIGNE